MHKSKMRCLLGFVCLLWLETRAFVIHQSHSVQRSATTTIVNSRLYASISSSSYPQVLCVGDALLDCIATDEARGWSVEKMTQDDKYWKAFPGGANANVATACAKLGTPSAFCGCVGDDADGDLLEIVFSDCGVNVELLQRSSQLPTRRVMVTRSMEGNREFGGFYQGRAAHEFADCELQWNGDCELLLPDTEWIVSGTLSLAFPTTSQSIEKLLEEASTTTTNFYVDINWRPVFWPADGEDDARDRILTFAQRAQLVKMTDEEAEWLLGIPAMEALENPQQVHKAFPNSSGVFVTAGEKGAAYSLLGHTGRVEPFVVNVQETTGAGDAFTAGILHGILSGGQRWECLRGRDNNNTTISIEEIPSSEDVHRLVQFAAAVGALTCTKEGAIAAQPTIAQVEEFLKESQGRQ
ncbi:Fructokinase-2 [Seminavis robusta]|uniref:Fructokinase-2 n=1 Tax=Seminavis robusta TaxID=568900 RepID=A0A9N8HP49_9STRA|nr:Fructokinase-2 [Seminavis robusta]|eukprot:Sro1144_g246110.1 Fructokinase-2 (410) ;mRNA; r:24277-25506